MLEKVIANAVKEFDTEVSDVVIANDEVTITYSDGDSYTGEVRIDGSTIYLDFHRTFIIELKLTVTNI